MAKKFDPELVADTRTENKKYVSKNPVSAPGNDPVITPDPVVSDEPIINASEEKTNSTAGAFVAPEPEKDEFQERFDEYFKGAGKMIAGATVVELVDDLKANLLWIYAKKSGVDVPKDALKMDAKSKELAAFCVDYAVKNKLFDFLKKYPLVAAGGIVAVSGVTSFLFIQMLKGANDEKKKMQDEIDKLKKERSQSNREKATDAEIIPLAGDVKEFVQNFNT